MSERVDYQVKCINCGFRNWEFLLEEYQFVMDAELFLGFCLRENAHVDVG
jgi:hypothetical protein